MAETPNITLVVELFAQRVMNKDGFKALAQRLMNEGFPVVVCNSFITDELDPQAKWGRVFEELENHPAHHIAFFDVILKFNNALDSVSNKIINALNAVATNNINQTPPLRYALGAVNACLLASQSQSQSKKSKRSFSDDAHSGADDNQGAPKDDLPDKFHRISSLLGRDITSSIDRCKKGSSEGRDCSFRSTSLCLLAETTQMAQVSYECQQFCSWLDGWCSLAAEFRRTHALPGQDWDDYLSLLRQHILGNKRLFVTKNEGHEWLSKDQEWVLSPIKVFLKTTLPGADDYIDEFITQWQVLEKEIKSVTAVSLLKDDGREFRNAILSIWRPAVGLRGQLGTLSRKRHRHCREDLKSVLKDVVPEGMEGSIHSALLSLPQNKRGADGFRCWPRQEGSGE